MSKLKFHNRVIILKVPQKVGFVVYIQQNEGSMLGKIAMIQITIERGNQLNLRLVLQGSNNKPRHSYCRGPSHDIPSFELNYFV